MSTPNIVKREFEDIETNLLFDIMRIADILMNDIDRRFQAKGGRFSQIKKKNYKTFITKIQEAIGWFDKSMEGDYWQAPNDTAYRYDKMRLEANELIQLLLLYIDRTAINADNYYTIFKFIRSLPSGEFLKEGDLEYFNRIKLHYPQSSD